MSKIKQIILRILSNLALLLSFLMILFLIIFSISQPHVFNNLKSVITWVFETLSSASIVAYFGKRIRNGIKKYGSLSESLNNLLIQEPLIHAMIWIFIGVIIGVFCYRLPVYSLTIDFYDQTNEQILDKKTVKEIDLFIEGKQYSVNPKPGNYAVYDSPRALTWGDSIAIRVQAKGYETTERPVKWPAFAILDVFKGVHRTVWVQKENYKITVSVTNELPATIHFITPIDTQFIRDGVIEASKDDEVEINVSFQSYQSWDTLFFANSDFTKNVRLKQKPVWIILRAFDQAKIFEYERMDIYINGTLRSEKSGTAIKLLPGTYYVRLVKELKPHERAIVDETMFITRDTTITFKGEVESF